MMVVMKVEGMLKKLPGDFLKLENIILKNRFKLIIEQIESPEILIS